MDQAGWQALVGELGFLIVPNGLSGHSTTEWLRDMLATAPPQQCSALVNMPGYAVRPLGISLWCEATALRAHSGLLILADALIMQAFARHGLAAADPTNTHNHSWLQAQAMRLEIATLADVPIMRLLFQLNAIASAIDIAQRGPHATYLPDFFEYGLDVLAVAPA